MMSEISQVVKTITGMTTKNKSNILSKIILCGVTAGYESDNNLKPKTAAKAVKNALAAIGAPNTEVRPAVCVYHNDWGCPVGGEPVGAFQLPAEGALTICKKLREKLEQSTLSVCLPTEGEPTIGFTATVSRKLLTVGARWQKIAAELMRETGTYISGGLIDNGDGTCTMSAEANPAFAPHIEIWRNVVEMLCKELGTQPEFAETKYNYLQKSQD